MSVPAVGRDLEDQASSGIRRHFRGVRAQIPVVVEEPEAPLGCAPAGVQVQKNGDQLGFGIGVDAAVLFPGAAANREHRRLVLQIHAQALAHQVPQLDAVHLLDERRKAARTRNGFRRKASPLADARKARHHFRESLRADDVADDEMRKGLGDQSGLPKRIRIQYRPHEPLPPPFVFQPRVKGGFYSPWPACTWAPLGGRAPECRAQRRNLRRSPAQALDSSWGLHFLRNCIKIQVNRCFVRAF